MRISLTRAHGRARGDRVGCHRAADAAAEAAIERASGQEVRWTAMAPPCASAAGREMNIATATASRCRRISPTTCSAGQLWREQRDDIGGARLLSLESDGTVSAMFDDARTAMERSGWTRTLAMQQADSAMLGFSQGEREATYTFTRHGDAQLMVGIQLRERPGQQ